MMDDLEQRLFIRDLLNADWRAHGGPIQFRRDLPLNEVSRAKIFRNTRTFLSALKEFDGAPATATGNLNREFSKVMFERLEMSQLQRESINHHCKVINEMDVPQLDVIRFVCEFARLISKRRKHFKLTREGAELLADDRAGELYHRFFVSYFRDLDLAYPFAANHVPGMQEATAVSLWRLRQVLPTWRKVGGLAQEILLPDVLQEVQQPKHSFGGETWILGHYILMPLWDFGLIERKKDDPWPVFNEKDFIRITPLFDRFIRFSDFSSARLN